MPDRLSSLKQTQRYTSTVAMGGDGDRDAKASRELDDSIDNNSSGNNDWKKYTTYAIQVDPKQGDRATEIRLCSFERPHMRAFHCSWWSFFIAFFIWFAIGPLLPIIRDDLNLTNQEIWTSSILGVGGTIFCRFVLGPLCDMYGARILFCVVLCISSIPTACTGLIHSARDLMVLRSFIGIAGGTFVMCEYWTSKMFCKEVVGTANAIVAGWGNLGAGVTQIVMGSLLFPTFKVIYGGDASAAWRTVSIVPAVIGFISGVAVYFIADDEPRGNYSELIAQKARKPVGFWESWFGGSMHLNTWYLAIQYACCFGVELTMNNATALYFENEFGQSPSTAGAIASVFGWMNLFARGCGGFYSDYANVLWGMKGRLWIQCFFLVGEGAFVLIFAQTTTLLRAIITLIIFSLFVQASEGASYGIVPYVDPPYTGTVSGIVGAGGNIGAVGFGMCFRQMSSYRNAFMTMGATILASSLLTACIKIEGQTTMFGDVDKPYKGKGPRSYERSIIAPLNGGNSTNKNSQEHHAAGSSDFELGQTNNDVPKEIA